jgi:hypothetical protein
MKNEKNFKIALNKELNNVLLVTIIVNVILFLFLI